MKSITSSIWGAQGTFPYLLALACAGSYVRQHRWHFKQPHGISHEKADRVGESLMSLASDLAHAHSAAVRERAAMKAPFFGKKRKAQHDLDVIAADEKIALADRQFEFTRDLGWAYIHATHPAYKNGKPSESDITADGILVISPDADEHPLAFPQDHAIIQSAVHIVRIIAGNDAAEQIGLIGELRANAHIGERNEPAGEPIARIEDERLKRLLALAVDLTDRDLGFPATVRGTLEHARKKMDATLEAKELATRAFWALASDEEIAELTSSRHRVGVRDDWSIVSARPEKPNAMSLFRSFATEALGLPESLVDQALSEMSTERGCGDPDCPNCGSGVLPDISIEGELPPHIAAMLRDGALPKGAVVVRGLPGRREPEHANAG